MYLLDNTQTNAISAGAYSAACFDAYKSVAEQNQMGLGQALAVLFTGPFGLIGVTGYKMGLRDAVKSICSNTFEETEAVYCVYSPTTCMKPKEKDSA